MDNLIYLDNAATTAVDPEVLAAMLPYFTEKFANPSSIYGFAEESRLAVEQARQTIAASLNAQAEQIYFTAGGSESDNWAIKATAEAYKSHGNHIITTKIEHHAVLHTCAYLEKQGFEVSYIDVDENGVIKLDELRAAIRPTTILISVMLANNEIGTIQPIREIGDLAHDLGIIFHTDAVQAYGKLAIDVAACHIDLLSASGHKLHGPKGVGFLYIKQGVKIRSLIHGGGQERRRRAGTENTTGIVGLGKAAELAQVDLEKRAAAMTELRDYLIERVLNEVPYSRLNGAREMRLPNNAHFCFRFIEGEGLLMLLDKAGICASSGSACTSGSLDPSHVLLAIGLPHEIAHGSLRLTLDDSNTKEQMDEVVEQIKVAVARLRAMSPLYADFLQKNPQDSPCCG